MNIKGENKWNVTLFDGKQLTLFYHSKEDLLKDFNVISIEKDEDYDYLNYIESILKIKRETKIDYRGREVHIIYKNYGCIYFRIHKDNDLYIDGVTFKVINYNSIVRPITWTVTNVKDFYNKYIDNKELIYEVYSFRKYGQPKLKKPKELKGINQSFSVDFIHNKCKCQCFVKNNDLYIKHKDFFSETMKEGKELFGTSLEYRIKKLGSSKVINKFIYPDRWGSIVLRNEAWIIIKNIKNNISIKSEYELYEELKNEFCKHHKMDIKDLYESTHWNLFLENIIKKYNNYIRKEELK